MAAFGVVVFLLAWTAGVMLYMSFASGFVASCIWAWFAVPRGLPPVSWEEFAAMFLLVAMFKTQRPAEEKKREKSEAYAIAAGLVIAPWVTLALAWWLT